SLKTSIKTITYLSDIGCLEIQGASLIHLWHNGKWDKSGELSQGRAYGVSLPWNNSLLIIGGETAGGKAVTDSVLISVRDNKVTVQN
ncbi:hypothetical protein N4685_11315, partial [Escherichia coli]|nr:hypothetical protein [Escherichia coli]MCU6971134.1 hypothetical protein [Escherichia coli]